MSSLEIVDNQEFQNTDLDVMHQDVLHTIEKARNEGVDRGYLNIATGCGKTRIVVKDISNYLAIDPNARILYLCHKNEILDQAREELASEMGPSISIGNIFGGDVEHEGQITLASFQQLNQPISDQNSNTKLYDLIPPDHYDYVVVDENHHSPAETYKQVIQHLNPKFLLGMTATPNRMDQQDISKIFGKELYTVLLEEAITKGYLCPIDYRVFTEDLKILKDSELARSGLTFKELSKNLFIKKQDEQVVKIITEQLESISNPRTIVFCQSIEDAEKYSSILPIRAQSLHSKLSPIEQNARLDKFKRGELEALTVIGKLDEGVDIPEANVVVFLRATESQTIYLQQLGRGLRRSPNKGSVTVLDFVANYDRIKFISNLHTKLINAYQKAPRQRRSLPFSFNYSENALTAIDFISKVRERFAKKQIHEKEPKHIHNDKVIEELFGVKLPPLTRMSSLQEKKLLFRIQSGDKSAECEYILWRSRLVYSAIKDIEDFNGLTKEDYFQIGCIALLEDARTGFETNYKYDRSLKIRAKIVSVVAKAMVESGFPKANAKHPMQTKLGRQSVKPENIISWDEASLSHNYEEDAEGVYETVLEDLDAEEFGKILSTLSVRDQQIMKARLGIGSKPSTLMETRISQGYNLSVERIRVIEKNALKHLKDLAIVLGISSFAIDQTVRSKLPYVMSDDSEVRALANRLGYITLNPERVAKIEKQAEHFDQYKSGQAEPLDHNEWAILRISQLHTKTSIGEILLRHYSNNPIGRSRSAEYPSIDRYMVRQNKDVQKVFIEWPDGRLRPSSILKVDDLSQEERIARVEELYRTRRHLKQMIEQYPKDAPTLQKTLDLELLSSNYRIVEKELQKRKIATKTN